MDMSTMLQERIKINQEFKLGGFIDHTRLKKDDNLEINGK